MEAAQVGGGSHGGVVRDSDDANHTRAPHAAATATARVKHALVILGEQVPKIQRPWPPCGSPTVRYPCKHSAR